MARLTKKKSVAVVAGVSAVALTGGIAFAYWTSTGSGTSTASTAASAANWDVKVDKGASADLYPTSSEAGVSQAFSYTVKNASSGVLGLNSVAVKLSVDAPNATTALPCDENDYDVFAVSGTDGTGSDATDTVTYSAFNVEPAGTKTGSFKVRLVNKSAVNQDGCKGATVTATVSAK